MEKGFDEKLTLDSETFSGMSRDYNFVLQRLLETMRDRDCDEGSITLNLKISLKSEYCCCSFFLTYNYSGCLSQN